MRNRDANGRLILAPGDVVAAAFPTYDPALDGAPKRRPAVVVSSSTFMASDYDVILCPITTRRRPPFDVAFGWESSGLPVRCYIRPKPTTMPGAAVKQWWGRLPAADWARLQAALRTVLDLSPQQDPE